jgi:quinol monooxygenase YgiN
MSSAYLIIAGLGAVAAAIGSGVMLARCFRGPRIDLVAWSVALIGLLISLGAQALGYSSGYDSAMFRAMELGAQVIAPLALILALSEVAGRTVAVRFCARVYIPAVAIVALVVLTLDQLASTAFTKAWPDPAVYYELPPRWVLMFAVGPITAVVAVIALYMAMRRSSDPAWDAVLPAQLAGTGAALLLAYPAMSLLLNYINFAALPTKHEFTVVCVAAVGLTWYAGARIGRIRLSALRGHGSGSAAASAAGDPVLDVADGRRDGAGTGTRRARPGPPVRGPDRPRRPERALSKDRDLGEDREAGRDREPGRNREPETGRWDDLTAPPEMDHTGDIDRYAIAGGPEVFRGDVGEQDDYGWETRDSSYAGREGPGAGDHEDGIVATGDIDMSQADNLDLGEGSAGWDRAGPGADHELDGADHLGADRFGGDRFGGDHFGADRQGAVAAPEPSRADLFGQIAIYTLLEDRVIEFDQLTERVVEKVRASEPDTLVFIIHAVPSAPMQRILYEVYRDRDAYDRHRQQPYVVKFEADRRPYVLATNVIELGLQQAKVSPFPSVSELFGEPGSDTSGFERPDYLRDYGRPSASQGGSSW